MYASEYFSLFCLLFYTSFAQLLDVHPGNQVLVREPFSKELFLPGAHISRGKIFRDIIYVIINIRSCVFSNAKSHFAIYERRCKEQGILMHPRAIPPGVNAPVGGLVYVFLPH